MEHIPTVRLSKWANGGASDRADFVRTMGQGLERFGFFALDDHGTSAHLLARCYQSAAQVFALPAGIKRLCETPANGRQRGYTSLGVERANNNDIPDLKEFWHVGRGGGHQLPSNVFPEHVPRFATDFSELFANQDRIASALLQAISVFLGWPQQHLDLMTASGNSVLRVIHYPALAEPAPAGAMRAAEHEDINMITVLPISTRPGLELLTLDGQWLPVSPPPGTMLCDTGDMMKLITGGRLLSTTHRVVNPDPTDLSPRYSMPFFCHPRPGAQLSAPGQSTGPLAADFLRERLRQNGVAN